MTDKYENIHNSINSKFAEIENGAFALKAEKERKELLEVVYLDFIDEQTKIWAPAAYALGKAAVWDRTAENYLQTYLLCATNIHRVRHALAALGAFAAHLENDRALVFFSRYRDNELKKKYEKDTGSAFRWNLECFCKKRLGAYWERRMNRTGLRGVLVDMLRDEQLGLPLRDSYRQLVSSDCENAPEMAICKARDIFPKVDGSFFERHDLILERREEGILPMPRKLTGTHFEKFVPSRIATEYVRENSGDGRKKSHEKKMYRLDRIAGDLLDEDPKVWFAAAYALGQAATEDLEAEDMMQEALLLAPDERAVRNGFAALGALASGPFAGREFVFRFRNGIPAMETTPRPEDEAARGLRAFVEDRIERICRNPAGEYGLRPALVRLAGDEECREALDDFFSGFFEHRGKSASLGVEAKGARRLVETLAEEMSLKKELFDERCRVFALIDSDGDPKLSEVFLQGPRIAAWWNEEGLENIEAEIRRIEANRKEFEAKIRRIEKKRREIEPEIRRIEAKRDEFDAEVRRVEDKLREIKARPLGLESRKGYAGRLAGLEEELAGLEKKFADLGEELTVSKNKLSDLESSWRKRNDMLSRLRNGDPRLAWKEARAAVKMSDNAAVRKKVYEQGGFEADKFDEWNAAAIVMGFGFFYPNKRRHIARAVEYILACRTNEIGLVANVPYVIARIKGDPDFRDHPRHGWRPLAKLLIETLEAGKIKREDIHLSEIIMDTGTLATELYKGTNSELDMFVLMKKADIFPEEFIFRAIGIRELGPKDEPARKAAELVDSILECFVPERKWRLLPPKYHNLPALLNILFETDISPAVVKDRYFKEVLSDQMKHKLLIENLKLRIKDNPRLAASLTRFLNILFCKTLEAKKSDPPKHAVDLAFMVRRQFYAIVDILKGWDWRWTLRKDAASVLVRMFESAREAKEYELVRELFYLVFHQDPEDKILENMLNYFPATSPLADLIRNCRQLMFGLRKNEERKNEERKKDGRHIREPIDGELFDERLEALWAFYFKNIVPKLWRQEELVSQFRTFMNLWKRLECLKCHEGVEAPVIFRQIMRYPVRFQHMADKNMLLERPAPEEIEQLERIVDRKTELKVRNLREIHLQLENMLKEYGEIWDSFSNFMRGEELYENIVSLLNDATDQILKNMPMLERELLYLSVCSAKEKIERQGAVISYLCGIFRDKDDREAKKILTGLSRLENLGVGEHDRRAIVDITEKYMLQRYMIGEIASCRVGEKGREEETNYRHEFCRNCPRTGTMRNSVESAGASREDAKSQSGQPRSRQKEKTALGSEQRVFSRSRSCLETIGLKLYSLLINIIVAGTIVGAPFAVACFGKAAGNEIWGKFAFGFYYISIQVLIYVAVFAAVGTFVCSRIPWLRDKLPERTEKPPKESDRTEKSPKESDRTEKSPRESDRTEKSPRESDRTEKSPKESPGVRRKRLNLFDLFLPKLLGMLVLAFPSIFVSDEVWSIAAGGKEGLSILLMMLYVTGSFLFIKHSMLKDIEDPLDRDKRAGHIFSLGVLESFSISMFFTCQISRIMGSHLRGLFKEASEFAEAKASWFIYMPESIHVKLPESILVWPPVEYFFSLDFVVYPKFVLFWTFQTLFVGVVLQMFVTKDKIVDS